MVSECVLRGICSNNFSSFFRKCCIKYFFLLRLFHWIVTVYTVGGCWVYVDYVFILEIWSWKVENLGLNLRTQHLTKYKERCYFTLSILLIWILFNQMMRNAKTLLGKICPIHCALIRKNDYYESVTLACTYLNLPMVLHSFSS